jgi:hypothetical protein
MPRETDEYFVYFMDEKKQCVDVPKGKKAACEVGRTLNPGPKRDEDQVLPDTFFNLVSGDAFPKER